MADIFLAQEPTRAGGTRHVVLKLLRSVGDDDSMFEAMFMREARLTMQLRHPNISHVYRFGSVAGQFFISMEWIEGVHLQQLIRQQIKTHQRVSVSMLVWTIAQVAGADSLHEHPGRRLA